MHNLLGNQVSSQYCPLDLPGACKRFLRNNKPRLVIILETEIWPNLLNQLNKHKIPVLLANARLSERSVDAYRRWASLFKPALNSLTHIFAQSDQDALNFLRLGVDRRSVSISGNLKFDYKTCDTVKEEGLSLRKKIGKKRPVWIAASTHAFEEEAVLAVFEKLKQTLPDLLLIWVPRHPERFEPLAKHLLTTSYQIYRLSQGRAIQSKHDILLCDVMGKLNMLYHASDVAFIGGSLTQGQGHNPLEAATADCAIITGDCISSFAEICGFLMKDQAQIIVADADALADATLTLFQNPELRAHMTQAALTCAQLHQGAVDKHMEIIQSCI